MSNVQFGQVLLASLSADKAVREAATQQLENASKENLALYLELLVTELAKEGADLQVRQAAGLAIKNSLTAKDFQRREAIKAQWFALDANSKNGTKQLSLSTLASADSRIGSTAAQVVAAIAALDLPHGQWNDLIPILLNNVTNNPTNNNLKRASLESVGFICEEIDPNILTAQANQILTAVISGARSDQPNDVRLTALSALYNSLEFVRENFNNEGERNYIMQVVCEATQAPNSQVQTAAFEDLVRIASLYYQHLQPYMERALFALTVEAMKSKDEGVALQAVEFWTTISEEEIELAMEAADAEKLGQKPERESRFFAKIALPHIIPVLFNLLTKQAEDDDDDEWNVSMAAGSCLSYLANAVGDDIIHFVIPFVEKNIRNPDWRFREASVMAFGSILEAPNPQALKGTVVQALPLLLELLNDQSVHVQDTTAWSIGRICELVPDAIDIQQHLPNLIKGLLVSLQRAPRVATNAAWSLVNLSEQLGEDSETPNALAPYFETIALVLLQTTERPDGEESNLRTGAYETLSSLVINSVPENKPTILKITNVILERLQKSLQNQGQLLGVEAHIQHSELQANLCALTQSLIRKLEADVRPYADTLMNLFLQMFSSSSIGHSATFLEDALLAVGSLTASLEKGFIRYMESFLPFLCSGLQNHQEYQVCSISVGLVGDICRALGEDVLPYCNTFMTFLLQNLQSPVLHRSVKPPILSTFGDIALAIGPQFGNYFDICMTILQQACQMKATEDDYDLIEYVNQLREGIFEAYTGIVQGLNNAQRILPHAEHIISFIREVHFDQETTDGVKRGAVGLLGDLANLTGQQLAPLLLRQDWLSPFLQSCTNDKNSSTREVAQWTREMVRKAML